MSRLWHSKEGPSPESGGATSKATENEPDQFHAIFFFLIFVTRFVYSDKTTHVDNCQIKHRAKTHENAVTSNAGKADGAEFSLCPASCCCCCSCSVEVDRF